jgi:hypothetical protein
MIRGIRWALLTATSLVLGIAPVSVFGSSNQDLVATVDCFDCQYATNICCADCSAPRTQMHKCTIGLPWCPAG